MKSLKLMGSVIPTLLELKYDAQQTRGKFQIYTCITDKRSLLHILDTRMWSGSSTPTKVSWNPDL